MTNLINLPGFNVSVAYDREAVAEAAAQKVAGLAYAVTKRTVTKGLVDSEKVVATGQAVQTATVKAATLTTQGAIAAAKTAKDHTEATLEDAIAQVKQTSSRVATATTRKASTALSQKIGAPITQQYSNLRARQTEAHDAIRARIDEYCDGPTQSLKAELVAALPPATTPVAPVKKSRKRAYAVSD